MYHPTHQARGFVNGLPVAEVALVSFPAGFQVQLAEHLLSLHEAGLRDVEADHLAAKLRELDAHLLAC